ncbi:geranylgeranyl reductase [Chloroherpeton thalassium ATCC 35110]|uniref:Geranylgeranyl reductase n=1 Tax=Chloroherpeton thalassium (strain ATCC 35110 / GB-78) TaxID=517418 RepID=B3QWR4_CHLT3|nr:NAD(P)/FAD-dependent oxidoreductase [Chloroherpeton thalassium]ACF13278.1 geranylgeranyl reductase [Chloroherpeton thalassium ATCC 35110]
MQTEVLVVGAGPAGSTAAAILAQKGYDVLILDKTEFPRQKACGDGIPHSAIALLDQLGLHDQFRNTKRNEITGATIHSPRGQQSSINFRMRDNFFIQSRSVFDHTLFSHALTSGAKFLKAKALEPILNQGKVVGVKARVQDEEKRIFAPITIAADGVDSAIAAPLRREKQLAKHRAISLRGYISGLNLNPRTVEGFFPKEIVPGYLWIFPLGEKEANIGLGMRMDKYAKVGMSMKQVLQNFLASPEIKARLEPNWQLSDVRASPMNFASQKGIQLAYDGAVLVGDAASLVSPLTGGGIYNAMFSAKTAAETIHDAFQKNDFSEKKLSEYERRCWAAIRYEMKITYVVQNAISTFPFLIEGLMKFVDNRTLKALKLFDDVEFS